MSVRAYVAELTATCPLLDRRHLQELVQLLSHLSPVVQHQPPQLHMSLRVTATDDEQAARYVAATVEKACSHLQLTLQNVRVNTADQHADAPYEARP